MSYTGQVILVYFILILCFAYLSCNIYILATSFEPKTGPFQKGDKVTAFGNIGEVKAISENGMFVHVKFPEFDSLVVFNIDGKFTKWNKNVSLRKI